MTLRITQAFGGPHAPLVVLGAGGAILTCATIIVALCGFVDPTGLTWFTTDFSNYWIASSLILDGKVLDLFQGHEVYFAHMQAAFGADYPWRSWSYPPHFLFFLVPLGLMPHTVAMCVFLFVTFVLFLHAASVTVSKVTGAAARYLLPIIICNVFSGQNGFLTSALLLYGLALRDRRPALAGIAFGLLTVKPQLGILLPFLLLYERRWATIGWTIVTAVATIALSIWFFGLDSWKGYLAHTLPYQKRVATDFTGIFLHMMPSTFGSLRSLDAKVDLAMGLHIVVAALAFAVFVAFLALLRTSLARAYCLVIATFLVSPYSLMYDLGALAFLSAVFARPAEDERPARPMPAADLAFALLACLPLVAIPLSVLAGAPIGPLALLLGLGALAWREIGSRLQRQGAIIKA